MTPHDWTATSGDHWICPRCRRVTSSFLPPSVREGLVWASSMTGRLQRTNLPEDCDEVLVEDVLGS